MPIKFENVGIAVRDLEATIAFFTELGLTVLGRDTVSGEWTDTAVGLDGNHANIAMLQTPEGNGRLELFEYIHPDAIETEPTRPNEIGMHRVAFSVDNIDEVLEIAARHGCHPLRGVATYRGRLQAHLCPRPQRHHRDARRGAEQELTTGRWSRNHRRTGTLQVASSRGSSGIAGRKRTDSEVRGMRTSSPRDHSAARADNSAGTSGSPFARAGTW